MDDPALNVCFQDNWIALSVQNFGDTAQSINLLDVNTNYSTTKYLAPNISFSALLLSTWTITTTAGATPFTGSFPTIDSVIDAFNATFVENGSGVFMYEPAGGGLINIIAYSEEYTFLSVTPPLAPTVNFTATPSTVISGKFVSVASESNVTLNEITQELVYQPYRIDTVSVYANTIDQANNNFTSKDIASSGQEYENSEVPIISPKQTQFVVENQILNYLPSPTNKLQYVIDGSQTLRIIFKYSNLSLLQMGEEEVQEDKDQEKKELSPIVSIVKRHIKKEQLDKLNIAHLSDNNIKKVVGTSFSDELSDVV